MFAIIEIGGTQFKVEKGTILEVGQLQGKEGENVEINKVLLLGDNGKITIGTPFVAGAHATAKIVEHKRDKKITVYKMKAKKRYRRTHGHKQCLTKLEITDVKTTGGSAPEKKISKPVAQPKKPAVKAAKEVKAEKPVKKPVAKKKATPAK
jgi:large subunit ribosomal protein L21